MFKDIESQGFIITSAWMLSLLCQNRGKTQAVLDLKEVLFLNTHGYHELRERSGIKRELFKINKFLTKTL